MYINVYNIHVVSCNGNSVKLIDEKDKEELSEGNGSVRIMEGRQLQKGCGLSFRRKVVGTRFRFTGASKTTVNGAYLESNSTLEERRVKSKRIKVFPPPVAIVPPILKSYRIVRSIYCWLFNFQLVPLNHYTITRNT